jgi:hypothetical protein
VWYFRIVLTMWYFGIVLTVWYFLFFILLVNLNYMLFLFHKRSLNFSDIRFFPTLLIYCWICPPCCGTQSEHKIYS